MVVRIGTRLHIVRAANPGIGEHRGAAARLVGRLGIEVVRRAASGRSVPGMPGGELVAHFMGNKINVKRIAHRVRGAGAAGGLGAILAGQAASQTAAAGDEYVANIEIGVADHRRDIGIVAVQFGTGTGIDVRIGAGVGVHEIDIVANQHQAHRQIDRPQLIDPVDAGDDGRLGLGLAAKKGRVLGRSSIGQTIGAQIAAGGSTTAFADQAAGQGRPHLGGYAAGRRLGSITQALVLQLVVAAQIAGVEAPIILVIRVDVVAGAGTSDRRMKAGRATPVKTHRGGRAIQAGARVGLHRPAPLSHGLRQRRLHHWRLDHFEALEFAARRGQAKYHRRFLRLLGELHRRLDQNRLQRGLGKLGAGKLARLHPRLG